MAPQSNAVSSSGKKIAHRVRASDSKVAPFSGVESKVEHPHAHDNRVVAKQDKDDTATPPIVINGKKYAITDPEWKTLAPMDGKEVVKHGNNTWRWCVPCGKWMFHDATKHDFWAVRNAK
jgi:hypothetical protein